MQETVAGRARQVADRIVEIPCKIVDSFVKPNSQERVDCLRSLTSELLFNAFPVISWIERRRSAESADLVKKRLWLIQHEAITCAGLEIPEYAGGTIGKSQEEPSEGHSRTGFSWS